MIILRKELKCTNVVEELKQTRKHPTAEKVEAKKDALKFFDIASKHKQQLNYILDNFLEIENLEINIRKIVIIEFDEG